MLDLCSVNEITGIVRKKLACGCVFSTPGFLYIFYLSTKQTIKHIKNFVNMCKYMLMFTYLSIRLLFFVTYFIKLKYLNISEKVHTRNQFLIKKIIRKTSTTFAIPADFIWLN